MEFTTQSFDAIGCTNEVTVLDACAAGAAFEIARTHVAAVDVTCSRFRADSELVELNARGHAVVSRLLLEAVDVALRAAETTGGAVDPTVGAALRSLGYDRDFDVVVRAGANPSFALVPATGWRSVHVDRERSTIRLRPGTELDLGATAKALAADLIAADVERETGSPVLVSLGGDIAAAGVPPAGGWPVLVTDDHRRGRIRGRGQVVAAADGGLATSSTTVRRWRAGRVELHHIVDPRTGAPAPEMWRTVTVAAPTCVDANVAATAAIVLGGAARAWLEDRGLPARLVRRDGAVRAVGGWPDEAEVGWAA
jgi:thiamine biosynthesis lipoprotein